MKSFLKVALVILIPLFIFIYFFIPNEILITQEVLVPQASNGTARTITDANKWKFWLPSKKQVKNVFFLENGKIELNGAGIASIKTILTMNDRQLPVTFFSIFGGKDTSIIKYETIINNRYTSPILRINNYLTSLNAKSQLKKILDAAGKYHSITKNIYNFPILEDHVKDSILITTHNSFTDTPSIQIVYEMIHSLEQYIQKNKGVIHGAPMVNITKIEEGSIFTQVAYPLAFSIPESSNFQIKKMVLGNILSVKVIGDRQVVANAFEQTKNYINDRVKTSPAIPFIVYNTNRMIEKDDSKWVSTIYYPVY